MRVPLRESFRNWIIYYCQVQPTFTESGLGLAMIGIQGIVYAAGAAVLLMNLKEV